MKTKLFLFLTLSLFIFTFSNYRGSIIDELPPFCVLSTKSFFTEEAINRFVPLKFDSNYGQSITYRVGKTAVSKGYSKLNAWSTDNQVVDVCNTSFQCLIKGKAHIGESNSSHFMEYELILDRAVLSDSYSKYGYILHQ